jgi:multicomponent Na+:H+ antiporter subunit D
MSELVAPGWLMILGAALLPFVRGQLRAAIALALPVLSLALLLSYDDGARTTIDAFGVTFELLRVDRLSRIFGIVFHIAAILSVVYMWNEERAVAWVASLVYSGAAIAATFVGDLLSLFVFWELTALSSVFLIWLRGTTRAFRAAMRYLVIQVASGVLLLAGAAVHFADTGSLEFGPLGLESPATWLIFAAFGIKAAFPLLHGWLKDAYPEATITGTVVLSAFTTKLAMGDHELAFCHAGFTINETNNLHRKSIQFGRIVCLVECA